MSKPIKEWFARAIVGMIWADGRIDQAEIQYLKGVLGFLNDQELVRSILQMIRENSMPDLEAITVEKEQALAMLKHLTSLSIVDEELVPAEEQYLRFVAGQLGMPSDIPDRLLSIAKKKLGGNRFPAKMVVADETADIICFGFSECECMFFSNRAVNPFARLTLRLLKDSGGSDDKECFEPFKAEAQWCRGVKSSKGRYVVKAGFKRNLSPVEGARLVLAIAGEQSDIKKTFTPKHNCLIGYYVQCRVCGERNIPFWQLRGKALHAKSNIFGIPNYDKSVGGWDFCDYNLYQVSVCPKCFFASNELTYFQRQDKAIGVSAFDKRQFLTRWKPTIENRRGIIGEDIRWLATEERTVTQALATYRLAVETHDALAEISDDKARSNHFRKSVSFIMIQAELLMNRGEKAPAEQLVLDAKKRLETAFQGLEKEAAIRAAYMLALMNIYFKAYDDAGNYLNFITNYSKLRNVVQGSEEYKTLNSVLRLTEEAWQERREYACDKLTCFHLND